MRGKHTAKQDSLNNIRNIPAYAGKTSSSSPLSSFRSEHPRVCGENTVRAISGRSRSGTSPRMRGKLRPKLGFTRSLRNIPAYAGKTMAPAIMGVVGAEHPRVCGENSLIVLRNKSSWGTSPRMRGKRRKAQKGLGRLRNIPAYAGKTISAI